MTRTYTLRLFVLLSIMLCSCQIVASPEPVHVAFTLNLDEAKSLSDACIRTMADLARRPRDPEFAEALATLKTSTNDYLVDGKSTDDSRLMIELSSENRSSIYRSSYRDMTGQQQTHIQLLSDRQIRKLRDFIEDWQSDVREGGVRSSEVVNLAHLATDSQS